MCDSKEKISHLLKNRNKIKILMLLKQDLICKTCNDVVHNPQIYQSCEHIFCLECLPKVNKFKCVYCKKKSSKVMADTITKNILKSWLLLCDQMGMERPMKHKMQLTSSCDEINEIPDSQPMEKVYNRSRKSNRSRSSLRTKTATKKSTAKESSAENVKNPQQTVGAKGTIVKFNKGKEQDMKTYKMQTTVTNIASLDVNAPGPLTSFLPGQSDKANITNTTFGSYVPKDIHKRNKKGETALHHACVKGNKHLVQLLIDAGATGNTRDNAGWTPLHEAAAEGHADIVSMLLNHGTLPDVPAQDNVTPLQEAVQKNYIIIANMLVENGASINVRNSKNETALTLAKTEEMKVALTTASATSHDISLTTPDTMSSIIVLYADNIDNKKIQQLGKLCKDYCTKIKRVFTMTSEVTHIIVPSVTTDVCELTVAVMQGLATGRFIINDYWIQLSSETNMIVDLSLFEIKGTINCPNSNAPEQSRLNKMKQLPGLFNGCHFYFHGPADDIKMENNIVVNKTHLTNLVCLAGGEVLKRFPDPERIRISEQTIPYHASTLSRLVECSHYVIYRSDIKEPAMKYNMRHIKSLPVQWLIDCIENFKLIEPIGDFYPTPPTVILS